MTGLRQGVPVPVPITVRRRFDKLGVPSSTLDDVRRFEDAEVTCIITGPGPPRATSDALHDYVSGLHDVSRLHDDLFWHL